MSSQVALQGITQEYIQRLLQQTLDEHERGKRNVGIVAFDASYLYSFAVSDSDIVRKLCLYNRYHEGHILRWHYLLERWYNDQTVCINNRPIKPLQIQRTFDKIVNEGLEAIAKCLIGQDAGIFNFAAIGDGDVDEALPGDKTLTSEVFRMDVTQTSEGGSLSRDGSTIYVVANFPNTIAQTTFTETGVFNSGDLANDIMLDHSVFPSGIDHDQNEDAQGVTTVIYMCGL